MDVKVFQNGRSAWRIALCLAQIFMEAPLPRVIVQSDYFRYPFGFLHVCAYNFWFDLSFAVELWSQKWVQHGAA